MYSFAGTSEGELPMTENELLHVVQNDGSGWVLVSNVSLRFLPPFSPDQLRPADEQASRLRARVIHCIG
jgi:hypothetical protein